MTLTTRQWLAQELVKDANAMPGKVADFFLYGGNLDRIAVLAQTPALATVVQFVAAKSNLQRGGAFTSSGLSRVPANQDKFVIMDPAGNPSLSNETFREAAIKSAGPELYSKVMPPGPEPVLIDLGDNKWKVARIFGALEVAGSTIHIFMQGFDQNGALVTPEAELTRIYATLQYGDRNANTVDKSRFLYYDHLSLTWGGRDITSGDGVSVNKSAYPWLDLTITKLYDDYLQIRWHMEYWSYGDQLYSMDAITEWSGTIGHRNMQQIQITGYGQYRLGAQLQITKC